MKSVLMAAAAALLAFLFCHALLQGRLPADFRLTESGGRM